MSDARPPSSDSDGPLGRADDASGSCWPPARPERCGLRARPLRAAARGACPTASLDAGTVTLASYEENAGIPALAADTKLFTEEDGNRTSRPTRSPTARSRSRSTATCRATRTTSSRGSPATGCSSSRRRASRRRSTTSGRSLTPQMPPAFKAASTGLDGHQYFVPNKNYPWAVHYRKSLWKEKGYTAPTTWAQFVALAKKMQADGLTPIAFTDKDGWPPMGWFDIINMRINGYEYHVRLMAGKQSWDSPQVKAVFNKWRELFPYYSEGALGLTLAGRRGTAREQAGRHVLPRLVPHRRDEARKRQGRRLVPVPRRSTRSGGRTRSTPRSTAT